MRGLALALAAACAGVAGAVDVNARPATKEVEDALRAALKTFETTGITFDLKTDSGPIFRVGTAPAFGPDVASRSLTRGADRIVELNPNSLIPLADVYRREAAKLLGLPENASAGDVRNRYGGADFNGDGKVDLTDFAILSANYGKSGAGLRGDLNRDGKVDDADLRLFANFYTLP
ncbi:dockerin type I domain-containing protein [Deinococcus pimensis]|uniref:dockerin type I domain-containing protein n=1 Tax=Deinococcus pimensis TaxID=309888 RepID=UPI0004818B4F|nr:dockerin type I domain-containing protein [Deinococcus pimensis]